MVMGFEAPKTSGVHYDIAPPPMIKRTPEQVAASRAKMAAAMETSGRNAAAENVVEAPEAAVEVPKSAEETEAAERLEYQKLYAKAMRLKKERAEAEAIRMRLGGVGEMPKYRDFAPLREEQANTAPVEQAEPTERSPQWANRYRPAA